MSVYPICEKCGTRRDAGKAGGKECTDKIAHKRFVGWMADWHPNRNSDRVRKIYGSNLKNPKELADIQFRQWQTDFERGELKLKSSSDTKVTFDEVADEWWSRVALGQNRIKNANRTERSRVNLWKDRFGNRLISALSLDDFEEWIGERQDNDIAVNTINRDLKPAKWILDYAVTKNYLEENPMDGLETLKGGRVHDRWMTEEEVQRLVQVALELGDTGLADFIAVGVNTGFRRGNLERITARDISGGLITARQTKSGEPYTVPVAVDLEPILRRLMRDNPTGPLLDGTDNNIGNRFREASRRAGLYTSKHDNDRVTVHTLRHTFAVLYLNRKDANGQYGDIYRLSKLLGHASVAITDKIYARFCPKEKLAQAPHISTPIPQLQTPQLKVV